MILWYTGLGIVLCILLWWIKISNKAQIAGRVSWASSDGAHQGVQPSDNAASSAMAMFESIDTNRNGLVWSSSNAAPATMCLYPCQCPSPYPFLCLSLLLPPYMLLCLDSNPDSITASMPCLLPVLYPFVDLPACVPVSLEGESCGAHQSPATSQGPRRTAWAQHADPTGGQHGGPLRAAVPICRHRWEQADQPWRVGGSCCCVQSLA